MNNSTETQVIEAVGMAIGRLEVRVVRALGDLVAALQQQDGMDGEKLVKEFTDRLPALGTSDEIDRAFYDAIRHYVGVQPLPGSEQPAR